MKRTLEPIECKTKAEAVHAYRLDDADCASNEEQKGKEGKKAK